MSRNAVVGVALLAVLLGGCSIAGRTFGTYVDDKIISGSVRRGIATGHWRALRGVNVDTYEGTVYLSGQVDTAAQKAEAETAAWGVDGVEQVINDLSVRADDVAAVSASPRTTGASLLQERIPGLRHIDPAPPGGPALAYDSAGAIVATVFIRSLRDISVNGFDEAGPTVQPINHISLYPVPATAGQPEALVTIVLWHISPAAAAALK
jgi:BON domain